MEDIKTRIIDYHINRDRLVYTGTRNTIKTKISSSEEFTHTDLYSDIFAYTQFLPAQSDLFIRLKCILQGYNNHPLCPICGKPRYMRNNLRMNETLFQDTCGSNSCIAKFNHINESVSEEIRLKHKESQTLMRSNALNMYRELHNRYITNDFTLVDKTDIVDFVKGLHTSRFKNAALVTDTTIKENIDIVCSIIYHTKFIELPDSIQSRSEFKFGERCYCLLNDISDTVTCKFCSSPSEFISFKSGYSISCKDCVTDKIRQTKNYPTLQEIRERIDTNKYTIIKFPQKTETDKLVIKCNNCGTISEHYLYNGRGRFIQNKPLCKNCEQYSSTYELMISDIIRSCGFNPTLHRTDIISPYEIDIYVEEKKLAIEIDGLYWHNDTKVKPSYHLNKTRMCEAKNIQLIHIFENELMYSKDIVESRLRSILNCNRSKIFARNCIVKTVSSNDSKKFQLDNHIQGVAQSSVNLGLYYNDELVSLMTFGKSRFNKTYEWELIRFCNILNTTVVGGASKLLTQFERYYSPKSLLSYADRRWSCGKIYEKLGFTKKSETRPDYWYYTNSDYHLRNRVNFQKHKLKNILEKFDITKSESENMKDNGYSRIYDCGNLVFIKEYEKDQS